MRRINKKTDDGLAEIAFYLKPMLSCSQIYYLENVLGLSPAHLISNHLANHRNQPLVLTPELSSDEFSLLKKMLDSIRLTDFDHRQDLKVLSGFMHILIFSDDEPTGRFVIDNSVHWKFPALKSMLGTSSEVAEKKKKSWTILQELQRELKVSM